MGAVSCPVSGLPDAGTPFLASAGWTGLACHAWLPTAPPVRAAGWSREVERPVRVESGPVAQPPLTRVLEL